MAMFVHLTPEKNVKAIQRSGIKPPRIHGHDSLGVFAMPVVPNFYISHQWLRELKSHGQRTIFGVYIRIPDDETVLIGHYNSEPIEMKATEAIALILSHENAEGYEVIIPRKIEAKEIHKTKLLPQVMGWRYEPGSHKAHYCGCPVCTRLGTVRSKIKNLKWEDEQ